MEGQDNGLDPGEDTLRDNILQQIGKVMDVTDIPNQKGIFIIEHVGALRSMYSQDTAPKTPYGSIKTY